MFFDVVLYHDIGWVILTVCGLLVVSVMLASD